MSSESIQRFNDTLAASPELQAKLRAVTSPLEFLALAKAEGCELSGADLGIIAQTAFQTWCDRLDPKTQRFFTQVRNTPALDKQLKQCKTAADAIALAHHCNIDLSAADLQQAAQTAATISGFSFEKLWFKHLGLL